MDRQKFLDLLNTDIKIFISNYLIDGNLEGLSAADDVNLYVTDCFPYLSTLYLVSSNYDSFESKRFIEKHKSKLEEETIELKARLGYFLYNKEDIDELKHMLEVSQNENEGKQILIQLLNEDISTLKNKNQQQEQTIITLQEENNNLTQKISALERKLKEESQKPVQEYHPVDENKGNRSNLENALFSDLIDMGTSVLWCAYNLGAENNLDDGDYYSWGALNKAEYFGKNVWGYKQVIKKNISGQSDCDAARSILGDGYRIPTVEEWKELLAVCNYDSQKVTIKGRNFVKLVSTKTNNTLLLPFIGHMESDVCNSLLAQYWTSEQDTGKSSFICQFHDSGWDFTSVPKWYGSPIRPVYAPINVSKATGRISQHIQRTSAQIRAAAIATHASDAAQRILSNLWMKPESSNPKRKYPVKSSINESNIFEILIKDCIPFGKYVFEGDVIRDINLDLNKLNKILEENYSLKPLTYGNIMSMRYKDFKALLLSRLSK